MGLVFVHCIGFSVSFRFHVHGVECVSHQWRVSIILWPGLSCSMAPRNLVYRTEFSWEGIIGVWCFGMVKRERSVINSSDSGRYLWRHIVNFSALTVSTIWMCSSWYLSKTSSEWFESNVKPFRIVVLLFCKTHGNSHTFIFRFVNLSFWPFIETIEKLWENVNRRIE